MVHSRLRKDVLVDLDDNTIVNHDSKRAKTMNISPTSVSISTLISRICGEHSKEWGPVVCAFLCNSGTDELIFPDTTLLKLGQLAESKISNNLCGKWHRCACAWSYFVAHESFRTARNRYAIS